MTSSPSPCAARLLTAACAAAVLAGCAKPARKAVENRSEGRSSAFFSSLQLI